MALFDFIEKLLRDRNRQMAWGRVPDGHVIGAKVEEKFVPNDDYVNVRMGSMFLAYSRELWLQLSPLMHSTVSMTGLRAVREESAVIGPPQFGDLAVAPAKSSVIVNQRLAGPAVWRGGDLKIAAGLFAVPKDQAASALMATLGQLAGLGIPGLKQGLEIANIVREGVEGLIGLSGTKPMLAVKVSLPEASEPRPCWLAGVAAPAGTVNFDQLWVKEGRLFSGPSAAQLRPFEDYNYVLLAVERGLPRQDWRGLPSLTPHQGEFDAALSDIAAEEAVTVARLNGVFAAFNADLIAEEGLTDPDKARIRTELVAEIKGRRQQSPFSIETRSVGGVLRQLAAGEAFSFLSVRDLPLGEDLSAPIGEAPFSAAAA